MTTLLSFDGRKSRNFSILTCTRKRIRLFLFLNLSIKKVAFWNPCLRSDQSNSWFLRHPWKEFENPANNVWMKFPGNSLHDSESNEFKISETVTTIKKSRRIQREQCVDIASNKATDEKSENSCRWRECRKLERKHTAIRRPQQLWIQKQRKK